MGFLAKSAIWMAVMQSVLGSPAPVPDPAITPAPILPRAQTKTLGYYTEGGTTAWESWLYDADSVSYTTSGNFFRRCSVGINCAFYTTCSSGWMVGGGGSTYCGAPSATGTFASNYCSWHVLQPSLSAPGGGLSWFWCDQAPLTGFTFFAKAPAAATPTAATAVSSAGASSARVTPANTRPGSSATTPDTPTGPTTTTPGAASSTAPAADNNKSSTPVGAIAGGVVGGIAVLGAIAFAIFFLMRRDKAKKASAAQAAPLMGANTGYNNQPPQAYPQTTQYYGAGGAPPGVGGYASEQKPQAAPAYYPPQQQQQYPHGPYDPHVAQAYQAPSPQPGAAELGAPVSYAPQELPAQQVGPKQ